MIGLRVVVLDDDEDLRDALGGLVGVYTRTPPLCLRSYAAFVEARSEVLACPLAILDINLGAGQPSGVDAFRWLTSERFSGRVLFLTGHGQHHPQVREASALPAVTVWRKPIEASDLKRLLEETARGAR